MSMESIGQKVATLLAEGAAEGIGGQVAVSGIRRIAALVRPLLPRGSDGFARDARATDHDGPAVGPADDADAVAGRQARAALARAIDDRLARDPRFRTALRRELAALGEHDGRFVTVVNGGRVGRIVNVGDVQGDVVI